MCGINGFISLNNSPGHKIPEDITSKIGLMNDMIAHRGPDSDGIYSRNPVCFGFPAGHINDNRPLIMGAKVQLDVNDHPQISFSE